MTHIFLCTGPARRASRKLLERVVSEPACPNPATPPLTTALYHRSSSSACWTAKKGSASSTRRPVASTLTTARSRSSDPSRECLSTPACHLHSLTVAVCLLSHMKKQSRGMLAKTRTLGVGKGWVGSLVCAPVSPPLSLARTEHKQMPVQACASLISQISSSVDRRNTWYPL